MITDGRFSGGTRGICIGHISPEAAEGGTIAILKDGDIIKIDIENYSIDVLLSDSEIKKREASLEPLIKNIKGSWLKQYRLLVTNASNGAILKTS